MQDNLQTPEAQSIAATVATAALKFMPAAVGAAIMVLVDPPKTKKDLFIRAFCAFGCSYLFGDTLFDFLDSTTMFAFLDPAKHAHRVAVEGVVGACGFFVAGGAANWLKAFKRKPLDTVKETREVLK